MTDLPAASSIDPSTTISSLTSQYADGLLGIPAAGTRLSWSAESTDPASRQLGYQLAWGAADASPETLTVEPPVSGPDSIGIAAPGGPMASRERRAYRVRIATPHGWTAWSDALTVEASIAPQEWRAAVIGIDSEVAGPAPLLRRTFRIDGTPVSARLHFSALGLADVWINGRRAGDEHLAPGWTAYGDRIVTATLDVTDLIDEGDNAIGAVLGDGWYRGRMGFADRDNIYGTDLGLFAQLEVELQSGERVTVVSDESWRGGFGEVLSAGIYDGTTIDHRLTGSEFSTVGFDDSGWLPARALPVDLGLFEPRRAAPVRTIATLPMSAESRADRVQLDAGQNVSGWVRLTVRGSAGTTVTVRHAEILGPDGGLYTAALRTAKATDTYTLGHDGESVLEPVLTFHGFRYADVVGDVEVVEASAIAISSDLPVRSTFRSSHAALDQFHSNVTWSQRDNFVSVPTDCPQRDERLGWTGDAQAFAATANTLFDSEAFWQSWLRDLELDQTDEGGVASVVPNIIFPGDMVMNDGVQDAMGRAGWADAATIVPLSVYESYGSDEVLRRQLDSMRRWVEHLRRRAGAEVLLPVEPFQYGDWLDPDAPGDRPWDAKVDSTYVANAFYVHSARLLARAEGLVGDPARAADYSALADAVAAATWERWSGEAESTQTGAALALEFGIAPDADRERIVDALAANVRAANGRISTGFLGTPLVLFALSHAGRFEEAYLMLLCREAPSWLYQVDRGATTVWERWDAIKVDGSIHDGAMDTREGDSMLSFNHYAYGAMIDWVYRNVAGLAPDIDAPGYRRVHVQPRPGTALTHASASIETRLGTLAIEWRLEGGDFVAQLTVPFGSTAHLDLPTTDASIVTVDDGPAVGSVGHGVHSIRVTDALVIPTRA